MSEAKEVEEAKEAKETVLVFGSTGMLGQYVLMYLSCFGKFSVIGIDRSILDAETCTIQKLQALKDKYQPLRVVNCVGKIPQRDAQSNTRSYMRINGLFPHILAEMWGNSCIHISTDCVFNGSKGNYVETDQHDETSVYGFSKSFGEAKTLTIIRTSIIGEERYNRKSLLEWVLSNDTKTISGYTNHMWNGLTCLQLSKIIHQMIQENITWEGIRHLHSESVSKYELIKSIASIYSLSITINPVESTPTNKTLSSNHKHPFHIASLPDQITEQRVFKTLKGPVPAVDCNVTASS